MCFCMISRPNSAGRRHLSGLQTASPIDAQNGGNDENDSVFSYYALDTIAINDDSDTEYFDAQGTINYNNCLYTCTIFPRINI